MSDILSSAAVPQHRFVDISAVPGLFVREHTFTVPLDHAQPAGQRIEVFAREVADARKKGDDLPWLIYFQGGPGFGSPRPMDVSGWIKRLTQDYRVLLLDQRGTGRSTPVGPHTVGRFDSPQALADYLKHFRQDSIVRDAELIRSLLIGRKTWTAYGQSFGGWCISTYLSLAPQGLTQVLLTGGLPPILRTADEVYAASYATVERKNARYYEMFPEDDLITRQIVDHLYRHEVMLPQGDRLTVRRFQQLGLNFYRSSGYAAVHYLLESAWVEGREGRELSYAFLAGMERQHAFETNPIFAILHEAIYGQGSATRWSADRVRDSFPQFEPWRNDRVLLTGEHIYPWMFEDYKMLRPFKEAADILAAYDGWPALYDPAVLAKNTVPAAAIVYYDDMCVVRPFSEETARAIKGCRVWVTNEYEHDGSGVDGDRILSKLLDLAAGRAVCHF